MFLELPRHIHRAKQHKQKVFIRNFEKKKEEKSYALQVVIDHGAL